MNQKSNEVILGMLEQGHNLLREGRYEEAIESFTSCLAVNPETSRAYNGRAQAHFRLQKWPEASADFARAKELSPVDKESWLGLGMSLALENKIYEAIDVLEEMLKHFPAFVRGHIQLGQLQYKLCATAKGKEQLNLALANKPSLAERKIIEQVLKEEKILDQKRYYRPDFAALNKGDQGLLVKFLYLFGFHKKR